MPFIKGHKINLGKKRGPTSEEIKKKLSVSHIGIKYVNRKRPDNFTEEHRKRMSASQTKRRDREGRKSKEERTFIRNSHHRIMRRLKTESLCHTFGEWELLKKQYGYTCPCCKKSEPEIKLTEDHIIPLSKGGNDLIENIQPLCLSCNCKKYTKIIKY
jgi:5-methylcytosine-specific restriction endonuclease McrA